MKTLSLGKYFGIQKLTSARGIFSVLAIDHRQNLRKANPLFQSDEELSRFKQDIISSLASEATSVLLDPEVSAAQAIKNGFITNEAGIIVSVESTGYQGTSIARIPQVLPGWSIAKAKRLGADAIKLLVYYHPDSKTAGQIETFVTDVAAECERQDIVFMLEPLSFSLVETEKLSSEEKEYVVLESAKRLAPLGVDILKAETPFDVTLLDEEEWKKSFNRISESTNIPWLLLSGAVDFELFLRQATIACISGASGVAVGRAVWKEAINLEYAERSELLQIVARQRMARITALCNVLAKPYTDFFSTSAPFDWYSKYPDYEV